MSKENESTVLDNIISILNKNPDELKQKIGSDEDNKSSDASQFHRLTPGKENTSSDDQGKSSNSSSQERGKGAKKEAETSTLAQSLREKLKKYAAPKEKTSKNIFEGRKFTFIPYDLVLTVKRITILTGNIQKKGGTGILYQNFIWNPAKNGDTIIIVTREMPYDLFMSTVPAIFQQEIQHFVFLEVEWITACLRENKLVDQAPYLVRWNEPQPKIEPKQKRNTSTKIADEKTEVKNERPIDYVKPIASEKSLKEGRIGATFLERNSDDEDVPVKYEDQRDNSKRLSRASTRVPGISRESTNLRFTSDDSGYNSASSDKSLQTTSKNTSGEDKDTKMEIESKPTLESYFRSKTEPKLEIETKTEANTKKESDVKRESNIKLEDSLKRAPVYIIDDNDDEVIFGGQAKKKMKLEEKGAKDILEGVQNLGKSSVGSDESSEFREYQINNLLMKQKGKEHETRESHIDKEEILLCQPQTKQNLNAHLTKELEKLFRAYELLQDKGRMHGYGKAIAILKALPKRVDSVKDVETISGIGDRMKLKIKEILQTGRIRETDLIMSQEKMQVLDRFDEIYGIGPTVAHQFYSKGLRTIDDLRKNQYLLNDSQKVGLKYYEEFKQKIPREIVTEISKIVEDKVEEISEYQGQFEVICGGSYRRFRGRAFCSDVDIIMSPRDEKPPTGFLMKLVKSLEGSLLTDHLSLPTPDPSDCETYLGVCYYKGLHRRIDFKICPRERFGPLTIYYTGGNYFNRSIRIIAEKRGYFLDNYGIFIGIKVKDKKHPLKLIPCYTEHDVFKMLGLKYIPPDHRDI